MLGISTVGWLKNEMPISFIRTKAQKTSPGPFAMAAVGINRVVGVTVRLAPRILTQWHMYTTTFDSKTGEWYIYIDGEEASAYGYRLKIRT